MYRPSFTSHISHVQICESNDDTASVALNIATVVGVVKELSVRLVMRLEEMVLLISVRI